MGAALEALTALEIAVRGGGRSAHWGRAGLHSWRDTNWEQPGSRHSNPAAVKILSRPSASACIFTRAGARHDHGIDVIGHRLALDDGGHGPQVLDAPVGARADEDPVELDIGDLGAGLQAHIIECPPFRAALVRIRDIIGTWALPRLRRWTSSGLVPQLTIGGGPQDWRHRGGISLSKTAPSSVFSGSPNRRPPGPRPRPWAPWGDPSDRR